MTSAIVSLLSHGGPALARPANAARSGFDVPASLRSMYQERNGFLAFDQALHVLPLGVGELPISVGYWNASAWRHLYDLDLSGHWFFAQDAFGNQFSIYDNGSVFLFDPEAGEFEAIAPSVEAWAALIMDEPSELTGWSLCRLWQAANGRLEQDMRLLPRIPFVLGGEYEVANLASVHSLEAIQFRAALVRQMKNLPDGTSVRIVLE